MSQSPTHTPPRKAARSRSLAELTRDAVNPTAAKLGFGEADILLHWDEIAGERLAQVCEPQRLQWPARAPNRPPDAQPDPAALVLTVEGAFALEVQHLAPLLMERVNARLGWRCIGRILIRQGPVRRRRVARHKPAPVDPDLAVRAGEAVGEIEDEALRAALVRLGARVLAGNPSKL